MRVIQTICVLWDHMHSVIGYQWQLDVSVYSVLAANFLFILSHQISFSFFATFLSSSSGWGLSLDLSCRHFCPLPLLSSTQGNELWNWVLNFTEFVLQRLTHTHHHKETGQRLHTDEMLTNAEDGKRGWRLRWLFPWILLCSFKVPLNVNLQKLHLLVVTGATHYTSCVVALNTLWAQYNICWLGSKSHHSHYITAGWIRTGLQPVSTRLWQWAESESFQIARSVSVILYGFSVRYHFFNFYAKQIFSSIFFSQFSKLRAR